MIRRTVLLVGVCAAGAAGGLWAQGEGGLRDAAERARAAWLAHDAAGLAGADSVALSLREGMVSSGRLAATQAARIIGSYLQMAAEVSFDIRSVRGTGPDQGYAEGRRRYVIRGTTDPVDETVLLGFDFSGGQWRLTEIRVTP